MKPKPKAGVSGALAAGVPLLYLQVLAKAAAAGGWVSTRDPEGRYLPPGHCKSVLSEFW